MKKKTALIIGASGLVGQSCLQSLLEDSEYSEISVLVRNLLPLQHENLIQVLCKDFDKLEEYSFAFQVNDVFCCVGTTIKIAKSKENFKKVDLDIPVKAAFLTAQEKAECFTVISSIGASGKSNNFYLKTKGMMESRVAQFEIPAIHIFRPSLLTGKRKERRFGEKLGGILMKVFNPFLLGNLKNYKAIPAQKVGMALVLAAKQNRVGLKIYHYQDIIRLLDK